MSLAQSFLEELDAEMPTTRRLLERVPTDKGHWKPHPKSFSLGHLAQLVSWMPGWITNTVLNTRIELGEHAPYTNETTETLLATFDKNVDECRKALVQSTDADLDVLWSLGRGDQTFMTMPRRVVVRQHINHLCHHRGQLTVYLRLIDVPLPSIYGPTADERWGG